MKDSPSALLAAACCKLILLTHSTKFIFLPFVSLFSSTALSPLNSKRLRVPCPIALYRRPPKQQKKHSSHSSPMDISGQLCSQKFFQGFAPKKRFQIAAFYAICEETFVRQNHSNSIGILLVKTTVFSLQYTASRTQHTAHSTHHAASCCQQIHNTTQSAQKPAQFTRVRPTPFASAKNHFHTAFPSKVT